MTSRTDADELSDCLWRHGLPASLVQRHGHWHVEIRSPREDPPRLVADLFAAVESLAAGPAPNRLRRVGDLR